MEKYKKIRSSFSNYEDMMRKIQLSNNTMESMNKIWPQQTLHINKKLKVYKT